jgi:hypothetical protein
MIPLGLLLGRRGHELRVSDDLDAASTAAAKAHEARV